MSPHTKLIEADILSFEFPASYEIIYCGALIHLFTLEDAQRLLSRIYDALTPGGILFINTTIHETSSEGYYEKHDYAQKVKRYRHRYTKEEFVHSIESSGFRIIDTLSTYENHRDKYWLALICEKPVKTQSNA